MKVKDIFLQFIKEPEFRIFLLLMYNGNAKDVLCEVYYHIARLVTYIQH